MIGDSQKLEILGIYRRRPAGIGKAQESVPMNTMNEGGYVPSTAHGSEKKKANGLRINIS